MSFTWRSLFAPSNDPPGFVVDADVTYFWFAGNPDTLYPSQVLFQTLRHRPVVSFNWPGDLVAAVASGCRAGALTVDRADAALADFGTFRVAIDDDPLPRVWSAVLSLARRYRLRAGPASALELALRTKLPLATVDTRLRAAAARAGVAPFAPDGLTPAPRARPRRERS